MSSTSATDENLPTAYFSRPRCQTSSTAPQDERGCAAKPSIRTSTAATTPDASRSPCPTPSGGAPAAWRIASTTATRRCGQSGFPNSLIADSRLFLRRAALVRGLMTDEEWAFFEPFVIETGPRRGRRPRDHRLVLDGVFWIARTGGGLEGSTQPFRRLELGPSSVQAVDAGRALGRDVGGVERDRRRSRQRPDDRFHHHPRPSARRRRAQSHRIRTRVLAARAVASRPRSISAATLRASLSRFV